MILFENNRKFLSVLYSTALVVFFLPLIIFTWARLTHRNYDENQQEQNGYNNNNNNNNNYDNNQQQQNNQGCRWWQWSCSDNYNYQENNGSGDNEQENALPWWWPWSEDERRRDAEDMVNPTLVVIYIWSTLLLVGILYYAYKTVKEMRDMLGLAVSMLMLANLSFISTLYLGSLEGGVEDDGRVIEEQGFYGQFGVLLFLTNTLTGLFGIIWFFIIRNMVNDQRTTKVDVAPSDYLKADDYSAPSVSVSSSHKENVV